MVIRPTETVIIGRLTNEASMSDTVVFKIKPTIAEQNIMREVLHYIREKHSGVWYGFLADVAGRGGNPKMEVKEVREDLPF